MVLWFVHLFAFVLNMWWLFSKCADCRVLHQVSCSLEPAAASLTDVLHSESWAVKVDWHLKPRFLFFQITAQCQVRSHQAGVNEKQAACCLTDAVKWVKWDGERFGVDTGTSKMKEEWERKSLTTSSTTLWTHHAGGKWQNDVMMIHHKVRIANQSYPLPGAQPQLFNIHSY